MLDCASVVVTRVKRALRVSKLPHPDTEQQHQASSSTEARYREMPSLSIKDLNSGHGFGFLIDN